MLTDPYFYFLFIVNLVQLMIGFGAGYWIARRGRK